MARFAQLSLKHFTPPLIIVDVGAAGELVDLGELNQFCEIHAFEPRREAYDQLTRLGGFGKIHVHNVGLASSAGRQPLYVTKEPSATSLRRANLAVAKRYIPNETFELAMEIEVDCTTLAKFAAENALDRIDYIKLDTQGTELEILRSAGELLDRVSIVRVETEFVELYQGQALFDDMVVELASNGFRFVDFTDGARRAGKRIWADALFMRHKLDRLSALRASMVLLTLGHTGEALWLLSAHGVDEQCAEELASARRGEPTWLHRLKAINQQRRSEGKLAFSLHRTRDLVRKLTFGILE